MDQMIEERDVHGTSLFLGNFYLRAIILGENIKLLDIYFINAYNIVEQTLVKHILVKYN